MNLTNEDLDALLIQAPTEALWAERERRIARRRAEIAESEAAWEAEIAALVAGDAEKIIRVRNLGDTAVHFIGDAHGLLEGSLAADHYREGRTFVETTRRVLEAVLAHVDVEEMVDLALSASEANTDEELAFAERSARRSAKTTREKITAALEGRRPRKIWK